MRNYFGLAVEYLARWTYPYLLKGMEMVGAEFREVFLETPG
jgi:hypothetical protein